MSDKSTSVVVGCDFPWDKIELELIMFPFFFEGDFFQNRKLDLNSSKPVLKV